MLSQGGPSQKRASGINPQMTVLGQAVTRGLYIGCTGIHTHGCHMRRLLCLNDVIMSCCISAYSGTSGSLYFRIKSQWSARKLIHYSCEGWIENLSLEITVCHHSAVQAPTVCHHSAVPSVPLTSPSSTSAK